MSAGEDLQALAEIRSQTWWFLGRLFIDLPGEGLIAELKAAFADAGSAAGPLDAEVRVLRECLAQDDRGALPMRLRREFTRLFRGLGEGYGPPPPYEALHRGAAMMGDPATSVRRHMEAAGFAEVVPEARPQDHLGAELRFLSLLCFREAESWGGGDDAAALMRIGQQRAFLDEHLLAWLPAYAARVAEESREPFYAAAARMTARFALAARAELDAIEAEPDAA